MIRPLLLPVALIVSIGLAAAQADPPRQQTRRRAATTQRQVDPFEAVRALRCGVRASRHRLDRPVRLGVAGAERGEDDRDSEERFDVHSQLLAQHQSIERAALSQRSMYQANRGVMVATCTGLRRSQRRADRPKWPLPTPQ